MLITVAVLALLQAPVVTGADAVVADVRRITEAQDNDQRFEALTALLKASGVAFTVEPFTVDKQQGSDRRTRGRNIVATVGQGPEEVVVGAHYDAVWLPDGTFGRGAVDNAASSVMLVRLAQAVQARRLPLRVTFVWFDMEEGGLLGSAKYLEAHAALSTAARPRAMLNFDVNGYGDTVLFGAPAGGGDPALRQAMLQTCVRGGGDPALRQAMLQTCVREAIDCIRFDQMPPSDDRSFGRAKIPTLSIAQLPAAEVHQLWLMLHGGRASGLAQDFEPPVFHTIHTADDVLAKIDGATLARGQRLGLALLMQLATVKP
jgi:Zn-dependent M28 family amino/carboxypeptidase